MASEFLSNSGNRLSPEIEAFLANSNSVLIMAGANRFAYQVVESGRNTIPSDLEFWDILKENSDSSEIPDSFLNSFIVNLVKDDLEEFQRDHEATLIAELPWAVRYEEFTTYYDENDQEIPSPKFRQALLEKSPNLAWIKGLKDDHQKKYISLVLCKVNTDGTIYKDLYIDIGKYDPETGEIEGVLWEENENENTTPIYISPELLEAVLTVYKAEVELGWQPGNKNE